MDEDLTLLERYERGDDDAFTELIARYREPLYRVAYRMVGHQEDALELVQQTFVRFFTQRRFFRREAKLSTWLYQILINGCRNLLRDRGGKRMVDIDEIKDRLGDSTTPLDPLLHRGEADAVQRAIESLPDRQRATVILRIYEERSFEEIAQILKVSIGTAKSNYHHGFMRLKGLFSKDGP